MVKDVFRLSGSPDFRDFKSQTLVSSVRQYSGVDDLQTPVLLKSTVLIHLLSPGVFHPRVHDLMTCVPLNQMVEFYFRSPALWASRISNLKLRNSRSDFSRVVDHVPPVSLDDGWSLSYFRTLGL
jgi:hypothetical protein